MSDTNPAPAAGNDEPLSYDDGVEKIADLLADPETDLQEEDQGQEEATEETEEQSEETEEATEEEQEQENDGPGYESGKFAAANANYRLKDGTVISVGDLARGYLSQQAFTRGTQATAEERKALASQKAEYEQHARTLQAERETFLRVVPQLLPQPPDERLMDEASPSFNPIQYMREEKAYNKKLAEVQQIYTAAQAEQSRTAKELEQQQKELRDREAKLLLEDMPELKKPEVYSKFWSEVVETMAEYKFSAEDLDGLMDHRFYRAMRDLNAYRRARANLPAVKQAVQSKPVLQGKKRMDPKAKSSRESQVRSEQLRRTGDFDAGVRALMDLDL